MTSNSITEPILISKHAVKIIEDTTIKYPSSQKKSAVLTALMEVQHENDGFLTKDLMDEVAKLLDMPPISVYEVATFYSMFETKPCGRNNVAVCTNISCMLRGSDEIVNYIEKKLKIKLGESTEDGRIYLKKEEECLAACCGAPCMQVNHVYYENLTFKAVDEILDKLK